MPQTHLQLVSNTGPRRWDLPLQANWTFYWFASNISIQRLQTACRSSSICLSSGEEEIYRQLLLRKINTTVNCLSRDISNCYFWYKWCNLASTFSFTPGHVLIALTWVNNIEFLFRVFFSVAKNINHELIWSGSTRVHTSVRCYLKVVLL